MLGNVDRQWSSARFHIGQHSSLHSSLFLTWRKNSKILNKEFPGFDIVLGVFLRDFWRFLTLIIPIMRLKNTKKTPFLRTKDFLSGPNRSLNQLLNKVLPQNEIVYLKQHHIEHFPWKVQCQSMHWSQENARWVFTIEVTIFLCFFKKIRFFGSEA